MHLNILSLIGNTPLVEIKKLNPNKKVRLFAKLESFNPGGSVKDRIALSMIEGAEKRGELTKDKIILDATSGNTGIGLALVGTVKGYKISLVMSEGVSEERKKILRAFGVKIIFTPKEKGTDGAIERAYEMARGSKKYWLADQFNNPDNVLAHYNGTGPEIWEQTKGEITHFVAGIGTSGTLMGVGKFLKEKNPKIKIIGVEPRLGHKIQGLKNMKEAYKPGIFNKKVLDEKIKIEDEEAYETARNLVRKEGIFSGMSSGASMFVALQKIKKLKNGLMVVLLPDTGERYLSTKLYDETL